MTVNRPGSWILVGFAVSAMAASGVALETTLSNAQVSGAGGVSESELQAAAATNLAIMQQDVNVRVKATNVTTDASGNWSLTWASNFNSTSPVVHAEAIQPGGSTLPYQCGVTVATSSSASGTCWAATAQTTTISIGLNLTSNPYASKVPTGTRVMVIGREVTQ